MASVARRSYQIKLLSSTSPACLLRRRPIIRGVSLHRSFMSWTSTQALSSRPSSLGQDGDRERVVILGSGWAGYTFALNLDPKKYHAIVVSPRSYFVFTPLLASTSVGTLEFRTALEPVRNKRNKIDFVQGWADGVDFENKTVTVEEAVDDPLQSQALTGDRSKGGSEQHVQEQNRIKRRKGEMFDLKYDRLVVSVGCYLQTFGTPGVREHALFLKDAGDARKIRKRLLACFETAALPTTSETMIKNLLNFAIIGGGPTGIEFSAELYDIITEDIAKLYPHLKDSWNITVYDVAPQVLSQFDEKLGKYAMSIFSRQGIQIKTSHHIEELREGVPRQQQLSTASNADIITPDDMCQTLRVKQEGDVGVGMVVWSTGLTANPFVKKALAKPMNSLPPSALPSTAEAVPGDAQSDAVWKVKNHPKSGSIITDDRLRVTLQQQSTQSNKGTNNENDDRGREAILKDVYALGDCAMIQDNMYPATAQVASQKAHWLAKHFNKGDLENQRFTWRNMGLMAYLGSRTAIVQTGGGDFSGRLAWMIWRGAYLTKSISWRNKILIPVYWTINWVFGRDISRF